MGTIAVMTIKWQPQETSCQPVPSDGAGSDDLMNGFPMIDHVITSN
jgi:hypothetical protein